MNFLSKASDSLLELDDHNDFVATMKDVNQKIDKHIFSQDILDSCNNKSLSATKKKANKNFNTKKKPQKTMQEIEVKYSIENTFSSFIKFKYSFFSSTNNNNYISQPTIINSPSIHFKYQQNQNEPGNFF